MHSFISAEKDITGQTRHLIFRLYNVAHLYNIQCVRNAKRNVHLCVYGLSVPSSKSECACLFYQPGVRINTNVFVAYN